MPRPQVTHDGFLIPNAADVTNPRMAEPDRIDFNTLATSLWGVVEGCEVTVAGGTASTLGGLFLVNGVLVTLNVVPTVSLGIGGTQDRFDLVVATSSGNLDKVVGTQAVDPVFPDPPLDATVLAAVFCPAGVQSFVDNVIDKRKFVPKSLLTKIGLNDDLVRNVNGTGDNFRIDGSGSMKWMTDTRMWRSEAETLKISKNLVVEELLTANNANFYGRVIAGGTVNGSNLVTNDHTPLNGNTGSIWQDSATGRIYVWRGGKWEEIATISSASPVGAILTSVEPPSVMEPLGWVCFNGTKINEEPKYAALFQVAALERYITAGTPRTMTLPNAAGYVLMGGGSGFANGAVGVLGGVATNQRTLTIAQMPRHGHDPTTANAGAASPRVTLDRRGTHSHDNWGGAHDHPITDPGHAHHGMDLDGTGRYPQAVICKVYGAENKLDALFNDSNHTHAVDYVEWSMEAKTKITVGSNESGHSHHIVKDGDHIHEATVTDIPAHHHTVNETERGGDQPFDITPRYLTVYVYVRS